MKGEIERFASAEELQRAATVSIARYLSAAIVERGQATLVLSGGSTPKSVYNLLATEPLGSQIEWANLHVFWGDERCVPPTHHESNFRMSSESLLQRITIPENNVHRIQAERPAHEAAELYAQELSRFFVLKESQIPRFDVVLLGLGEDGHTASLFPGTTILNETRRTVADVFVPKLNASRISMTYPVFNNARVIMFLVAGHAKAEIVRDVLESVEHRYPAQRIQPDAGTLFWLLDDAAASLLKTP